MRTLYRVTTLELGGATVVLTGTPVSTTGPV